VFPIGLVALYSEEVLEAMSLDSPHKYRELMAVLKERQLQEIVRARIHEAKRMAAIDSTLEKNVNNFIIRVLVLVLNACMCTCIMYTVMYYIIV